MQGVQALRASKARREKEEGLYNLGYWPVCMLSQASTLFVSWDIPCTLGPEPKWGLGFAGGSEQWKWIPIWIERVMRVPGTAGLSGGTNSSLLHSWAAMSSTLKLPIAQAKERYLELRDDPGKQLILLASGQMRETGDDGPSKAYKKALNAAIKQAKAAREKQQA